MSDLLKQAAEPQQQSYRTIPLTQDQFAIVDEIDYEFLVQWKWFAWWSPCTQTFYAKRNFSRAERAQGGAIAMHQAIAQRMNIVASEIDHQDGNTLNNRRYNLRPATRSQNSVNRKLNRNNTSGVKGAYFRPKVGLWESWAHLGGPKQKYLGRYKTAEEAGRAYDEAVINYYGEYARPNFPSESVGAIKYKYKKKVGSRKY